MQKKTIRLSKFLNCLLQWHTTTKQGDARYDEYMRILDTYLHELHSSKPELAMELEQKLTNLRSERSPQQLLFYTAI